MTNMHTGVSEFQYYSFCKHPDLRDLRECYVQPKMKETEFDSKLTPLEKTDEFFTAAKGLNCSSQLLWIDQS